MVWFEITNNEMPVNELFKNSLRSVENKVIPKIRTHIISKGCSRILRSKPTKEELDRTIALSYADRVEPGKMTEKRTNELSARIMALAYSTVQPQYFTCTLFSSYTVLATYRLSTAYIHLFDYSALAKIFFTIKFSSRLR